ncbi:MAG: DUF1599 domain-containing protein [Flavobacteriales bacterium]|nr:DUF1599 domain-containing protein [Flavobacteriales bacterium]
MSNTTEHYDNVIVKCTEIFKKKTIDYGTAWRILRSSSLTDQIFIKANRIRTIQEAGSSKVDEGVESEFIGIINYCIMALIQIDLINDKRMEIPSQEVIDLYHNKINISKNLMVQKNHDYGEAWRDMRVSSLTDLILMKILRVKQIEDNKGKTIISEGIDANYFDMINYSVFAMIHLLKKLNYEK